MKGGTQIPPWRVYISRIMVQEKKHEQYLVDHMVTEINSTRFNSSLLARFT